MKYFVASISLYTDEINNVTWAKLNSNPHLNGARFSKIA